MLTIFKKTRKCTAVFTVKKKKKLALVQSCPSQWRNGVQCKQPGLLGFPSCTELLPESREIVALQPAFRLKLETPICPGDFSVGSSLLPGVE